MRKLEQVLDKVIEKVLAEALTAVEDRARTMVEAALSRALEARLEALLEGALRAPAPAAPAPAQAPAPAPARAREEAADAAPAPAPRKRKGRATTTAPVSEDDLEVILGGVEAALAQYTGAATPRGKPLPEVLYRRVRHTLRYARDLGRTDLAPLARSALVTISGDPRGWAMRPWPALAMALGLPDPVAGEGE